MAYQALYRKWRPKGFFDMVGQEAITKTLKNAIVQEKFSHAYLFTGPRGTGKTSAAKIVAKAINCLEQTDGEPCNHCAICQSIREGSLSDMIEIDAASNNGVEEIREIREKARYAPTQAKYKVYIIDEVHMLSTGAFNALLKTLEEPPQQVIFILATTEPHKIPATIISRTQRFDFKRITNIGIEERLAYVLEQEGISYEKEALTLIARMANGGMRDALSLLDQTISFGKGEVTLEEAIHVSGSLTEDVLRDYLNYLTQKDLPQALSVVQSAIANGKEAHRFVEELIVFIRDTLVRMQMPTSGENTHKIDFVDAHFLHEMIEILQKTQQDMKFTSKPEITLEVMTMKCSYLAKKTEPQLSMDVIEDLKEQIRLLQAEVKQVRLERGQVAAVESTPVTQAHPVQKPIREVFKPNMTQIHHVLDQATRQELMSIREVWQDLLSSLTSTQKGLLRSSEPVAASSTGFVLKFQYDILCDNAQNNQELQEAVSRFLNKVLHYNGQYLCVQEEQWPVIRRNYLTQKRQMKQEEATGAALDEEIEEIKPSPVEELVTETIELFGQEIVHIQE